MKHVVYKKTKVRGSGGGKAGSGSQPVIAPDSVSTVSYARIIELLGEGPMGGLVNGAASIFTDGTPLYDLESNSPNFENFAFGMRFGDPDQDWLPGFSSVETETSIGVEVKFANGPLLRETTTISPDALIVTIRWAALYRSSQTDGSVGPMLSRFTIEYKNVADSAWTSFTGGLQQVYEKNSTGFERQYYQVVSPPGAPRAGPWQVRVTRFDPDDDGSPEFIDAFSWQSMTEVIEQKLLYPDSCYMGLQLPAYTFNGGVPTRTYDVYGRIVRTPSNRDHLNRIYTGIWDGTFQLAWTDNPAWCLFDMLTNTRYGLRLPDNRVDFAALYTIGQYCDELIPDGFGGMRPRFTLNMCISNQEKAYDLINKIVAIFNTMVYYSSGGITFFQDSPRDVDMLAVPGNVVDGIFTYQEASYLDTPNTILVTWNNPDLDGKGDIEIVQDTTDIVRRGAQLQAFDALGVTNRSQARMTGRWLLYTGFFNGSLVTYKAGLDHADVMPGWIIGVRDPVMDTNRSGGRIVDAVGTTITLDAPVTIDDGSTPTILLLHSDKTVNEYNVVTAPGTYSQIDVDTVLPNDLQGSVWSLQSTLVPIVPFRVISKTPVDKTTFEITAIKHHADKYALVESNLTLDVDQYTSLARNAVAAPPTLVLKEFIFVNPANAPTPSLLISWGASGDPRVSRYQLQSSPDGTSWTFETYTTGLSFEVDNIIPGLVWYRVRGETPANRFSAWTSVTGALQGLDATPADVTGLNVTILNDRATLQWDVSTDPLVESYEVRFTTLLSGFSWVSSFPLAVGVVSNQVDVPSLTGTYSVRAVSYTGKYSANSAVVSSTIASETAVNVVQNLADEPSWAGTKVQTAVVSGKLQLATTGGNFYSSGTYNSASTFDMGASYLCRLTPTLSAVGNKVDDTLSTWTTLAAQATLSGVSHGEWNVAFEFRTTDDDPGGSPTWSDWQPVSVGTFKFRALQWRLTLTSVDPQLTPVVTTADILIDMPDRVEAGKNIAIPALGTFIVFDPPFKVLDGISVAMQGLLATDTFVITTKDVSGFGIVCFDSSHVATNRGSFDYVAKGYGKGT